MTRPLTVRLFGLGEEGGRALPGLERAVRRAWAACGPLEVRADALGDYPRQVRSTIKRSCDRERADVVLTIGRSGHLRGDFAPEATAALLERPLPGIEERMCLAPPRRPADLLFRGRAGLRGTTLVVNLPGQPARAAAIVRFLAPILGHALGKARGDGAECARPGSRR